MSEKIRCPKCGEEMAEGFILDDTHAHANFIQARWVEGKPVPSRNSGIKWNDKEAYKIAAYRCPSCGLLELHAIEPTKYPEFP